MTETKLQLCFLSIVNCGTPRTEKFPMSNSYCHDKTLILTKLPSNSFHVTPACSNIIDNKQHAHSEIKPRT